MIKKFIEKAENIKPFNDFLIVFLWIFLLSFIRTFEEYVFFNHSLIYSIFLHSQFFFFVPFTFSIAILYYMTKANVKKIMSFVSICFILILLAPPLDYFFFGRTYGYKYVPIEKLPYNMFTLFIYEKNAGIGLVSGVILIIALFSLYVYHKTKSPARGIAVFLMFYLFAAIISSKLIYSKSTFDHEYNLIMILFYLALSSLALLSFLYKSNKKLLASLIKNFRFSTTFFSVFTTFLGAVYAGLASIPFLLSALSSIFLSWQFAVILNDIYDKDIDKVSNKSRPLATGSISEQTYLRIAIIFFVISTILTIATSKMMFLIFIPIHVLAILYSVPPFRIRKHLFSEIVIGLGAFLAFLLGFFSQKSTLSTETLLISFIVLLGSFLASIIKDIKDFKGDKKQRIKTIFTIYGFKRGKQMSTFFLIIAFLSPIFLATSLTDTIFFILITLIALIDFTKKENVPRIILYYLISITFLILRIKLII